MAGTDLVYRIGADTAKFDAAMSRVRDTSDNTTGRMLNSFQRAGAGIDRSMAGSAQGIDKVNAATTQATQNTSALGSAVNGLVTGIAVLEASGIIVKRLGEAIWNAQKRVEALLEIAAGSQGAGVGTTLFQTLTAQAKDLGIEAGVMARILGQAREAAIVRIGEGKDGVNASAFGNELTRHQKAGNITAEDRSAYDAAGNQEERIRAVLDLMDKLRSAQMNLAAQDLGKSFFGADFERLSAVGVDLVGALRRSLDGMQVAGGVRIASPEEVERVKQLNEATKEVNNSWTKLLQQPLADIAYAQDLMAKSSVQWQQRIAEVAGSFADIYARVRSIAIGIKEAGQSLGLISPDFTPTPKPGGSGPMEITVNPRGDRSKPKPALTTPATGAQDPDAVEAFIRQLNRARDVAEAELKTVGLTNVEREKAVALARAEAAARDDFEKGRRDTPKLDDDEKSRVLRLANETAQFTDRQKDLNQALQQNAQTMREFGQLGTDALADMILEGKSFNDVLTSLSKTLVRSALQGMISGTGPLAGFLGTAAPSSAGPNAMGGLLGLIQGAIGKADGGIVHAAGGGMIHGPGTSRSDSIPAMLSDGEFVVQAAATSRHRPLLEAINRGSARGYRGGGFVGAMPFIPIARSTPAGGGLTVIDRRTNAPPVQVERGRNGGRQLTIRDAENSMSKRIADGKSSLADLVGGTNSAAFRTG